MFDMEVFYKEYKENVEILVVNYMFLEKGGGEEKVSNFIKEKGIIFFVLLDKNIDVIIVYKVIMILILYFIDIKGVI